MVAPDCAELDSRGGMKHGGRRKGVRGEGERGGAWCYVQQAATRRVWSVRVLRKYG